MPKPTVCLSEQLRQYLETFRSCFSWRQWKHFVIVLLGLIECEERKTLTGLLRVVGEQISLSGLSRFLNQWSWSPEKVAQTWLQRFRQRMAPLVQAEHQRLKAERSPCVGRSRATVVTGYLIFDDSVHVKPKGRKMKGLGRHDSSTEQRVVNGHCLFTGPYSLMDQRCPLTAAMYRQKMVCQLEGVPFMSKIDLAVRSIEGFEPVPDTQTHLLTDSWYHCKQVRRAAQARGWDVSGGLKSKMHAHRVQTWIRKPGPTLLLITCHDPAEPLKRVRYWGSTVMELDAQTLVDVLAKRWEIETFSEYDKDLLGSDHYQVMTADAIIRFWTLTACLLCFLEEQRTTATESGLTCGHVRRRIQEQHRRDLLCWLRAQFEAGLTVHEIGIQLAISSSQE
jgi:hypothetical protein